MDWQTVTGDLWRELQALCAGAPPTEEAVRPAMLIVEALALLDYPPPTCWGKDGGGGLYIAWGTPWVEKSLTIDDCGRIAVVPRDCSHPVVKGTVNDGLAGNREHIA